MDDDHQMDAITSAFEQVEITTTSRNESTAEELSSELRLGEFLERFEQLSWDLACSQRESNATPEQAQNAAVLSNMFTFWIYAENVKTVEDASVKGRLVGELLYELALVKEIEHRHVAQWFNLIEDGVESAARQDWEQLLRPEDSDENKQFNRLLANELEYLKEKQRAFLSAVLKALAGYDGSDTATEGSNGTAMELDHMWKGKGKEVERDN